MKNLYITNGDRLEVDWSLVRTLTSSKFVAKVMKALADDDDCEVFSVKKYDNIFEVILKDLFSFRVYQYVHGEMFTVILTHSDITEMYQSI